MGKKKLSAAAQAAAVREQMRSSSLDQVEKDFPDLSDGIKLVRQEQGGATSTKAKGSGNRAVKIAKAPLL